MSNKYERLSFDSIDSTDSIDKLASDDVEGTNHTNNNSTLLPPSSSGHTRSISNLSEFDLDDEDYEPTAGLLPEEQNRGALSSFGANEALMAIATESGKSDMKMAFMNMANSIIGAGIIGQPYAVRQSGLIGGIILLLVLTVVIDWTIRLMVVNAKISGTDTFQATVSKCYGLFDEKFFIPLLHDPNEIFSSFYHDGG